MARAALAALCLVAALFAGCGEGSGVAAGATVTVYVAGALCAEAKHELAQHGPEARGLHLRAICLPRSERGGKLDLATVGANARRATEDSSSIAYIGEPTQAASRFGETILEEAGIRQYAAARGTRAMSQLLSALEAGRVSPR